MSLPALIKTKRRNETQCESTESCYLDYVRWVHEVGHAPLRRARRPRRDSLFSFRLGGRPCRIAARWGGVSDEFEKRQLMAVWAAYAVHYIKGLLVEETNLRRWLQEWKVVQPTEPSR